MVYPIGKYVITGLFRLFFIKRIKGLENLPKDKAFIVACNHASFLDDFIVPAIITKKTNKYLHMYCNDSYFSNPITGTIIRWGRVIPIRVYKCPEKKDINEKAFNTALDYLKKGDSVGIFPEGHRTKDGKLKKAYQGIAKLVIKSKAPVIPIGLKGTFGIWPKGKKLPRFKRQIIINIGKPLYFKSTKPEEITRKIMQEIAKLTDQEYEY